MELIVSILKEKKLATMIQSHPTIQLKFVKKRTAKHFLIASTLALIIIGAIPQLEKFSLLSSDATASTPGPSGFKGNAEAINVAEFKERLKEAYHGNYTTRQDGVVSVSFRKNSVYLLDAKTSYQEIVTANSLIKMIILRQLNDHGIEYQETESSNAGKTTWVISWGGLLYFPDI